MISRILGGLAAAILGFVALGPVPVSAGNEVPVCKVFMNTVVAALPSTLESADRAGLGRTLSSCPITLAKSVSNPSPSVGDTIQWVVTVHNGSLIMSITDFVVTDTPPSLGTDLLFSSDAATKGTLTGLAPITWNVGTLSPGETEKLFVNEIVNSTKAQTNCADLFVAAPSLKFVPEVSAVPAVLGTPGHPGSPAVPAVPASLQIEKDYPVKIKLAQACATETPQVPMSPPPATSTPSSTPAATPTPATNLTSVGLPGTGRRA